MRSLSDTTVVSFPCRAEDRMKVDSIVRQSGVDDS
jgi:hypothetical protein